MNPSGQPALGLAYCGAGPLTPAKTMIEMIARRLREVTVRPTVGVGERRCWDALMGAHHYLPFRGLVGRSVRHVAVLGEHWLALIGWHAGAFKLQARDRWIGWLPEQQFRRLHLIANNAWGYPVSVDG